MITHKQPTEPGTRFTSIWKYNNNWWSGLFRINAEGDCEIFLEESFVEWQGRSSEVTEITYIIHGQEVSL